MKRLAYHLGAAALLIASCSVQEEEFRAPVQDETVFYASLEQPTEEETRVYVNDQLLLRWHADDRVSIFNRNTYNQQYRFDGETGDNGGAYSIVSGSGAATGNPIADIVAVYPYRESTQIDEDEVLTVELPAIQSFADKSFGREANTMVSVTSDDMLQFKSLGGYLKIKLYGEDVTVYSVSLKGNKGEKLSGKATVIMPLNGNPSIEMAQDAGTEITLKCEEPVTLGATADLSTEFWFAIPPVDFEEGFVISVQLFDGYVKKATSKHLVFERNRLYKMAPFKISKEDSSMPVPEPVDLGLSVQWASFNLGADKPEDYGFYYSWGETEPKEYYDWETYQWCIDGFSKLTKYNYLERHGNNGFVDGKMVLEAQDDAAAVKLGDGWRYPTKEELEDLRTRCTWEWVSQNGVYGCKVTGPNGNSIFLPAAGSQSQDNKTNVGVQGIYWSSTLSPEIPFRSVTLHFQESILEEGVGDRRIGHSIRPVYVAPPVSVTSVSVAPSELEIEAGDSAVLTAAILPENATNRAVVWSTSDPSVAIVSETGVVEGVSMGSASITVTTDDGGKTAVCFVTVKPAVPEIVDLGLSVQWASFNLGAGEPEGVGNAFAWGETEPRRSFEWANYKWSNGSATSLTKYNTNPDFGQGGFVDWNIYLDIEDDAAHILLGDQWRLPTKEELVELQENCTWVWTTVDGVPGNRVTGPNGNSIFLPAAGCHQDGEEIRLGTHGVYWSSSLADISPDKVYNLGFDLDVTYYNDGGFRYHGHSIRPVYGASPIVSVESISLDKEELVLTSGDTETLHVTILPVNATDSQYTWSSSDENVATVSADGIVKGLVPGTAVIVATARDGGKTASCAVTVASRLAVPEAIDLGLSVKWASFNLGADSPEKQGNYYAWGEVETKTVYNWSTYKYGSSRTSMTKYIVKPEGGVVDNLVTLEPEDDAAYQSLGYSWRMPTKEEVQELIDNCTWEETTDMGVNGYRVTSKKAGYTEAYIFLPKAGARTDSSESGVGSRICYWSSSFNVESTDRACYISNYYSNTIMCDPGASRTHGLTIRPVVPR